MRKIIAGVQTPTAQFFYQITDKWEQQAATAALCCEQCGLFCPVKVMTRAGKNNQELTPHECFIRCSLLSASYESLTAPSLSLSLWVSLGLFSEYLSLWSPADGPLREKHSDEKSGKEVDSISFKNAWSVLAADPCHYQFAALDSVSSCSFGMRFVESV